MSIDFTFATDVLNPQGKVRLVTSLEIEAQILGDNGDVAYSVPVGMAQSMDVDESRSVEYNFVIGNKNPSRARDLIPGPVNKSTIRLEMVSLYSTNGIGLFVPHRDSKDDPITRPTITAFAPALPYNTRPFNLCERWFNPTTGNTLYTIVYTGCFIESMSTPKKMSESDIRVIESMDVVFKDITWSIDKLNEDATNGSLGNPFRQDA